METQNCTIICTSNWRPNILCGPKMRFQMQTIFYCFSFYLNFWEYLKMCRHFMTAGQEKKNQFEFFHNFNFDPEKSAENVKWDRRNCWRRTSNQEKMLRIWLELKCCLKLAPGLMKVFNLAPLVKKKVWSSQSTKLQTPSECCLQKPWWKMWNVHTHCQNKI